MKKILIIGTTCVDVIINVDHLPTTKASVNIYEQEASMGGCAYNASDSVRNFGVPCILFSPVGTGIYGEFILNGLKKKGLTCPIPQVNENNGCCYCFVEENGERTFISHHGCEYLIHKEWLDKLDENEIDSVYICGLEIEEKTGWDIINWLNEHPKLPVFFATGPRIQYVPTDRMSAIFKRNAILHLNDDEAKLYTKKDNLDDAMNYLYGLTNNTVIVTQGSKGASWIDKDGIHFVASTPCENVVDTIGAGDSHIGSIMACLYKGMSLYDAISMANKVSSKVVSVKGALLSKEEFDEAINN